MNNKLLNWHIKLVIGCYSCQYDFENICNVILGTYFWVNFWWYDIEIIALIVIAEQRYTILHWTY